MTGYPLERIYEEVAFLAYYSHWGYSDIIGMDHQDRQRWCKEISKINNKINNTEDRTNLSEV